ncbi:MAG: hypothetical protein ACI4MH_00985 [Candidatus Coproplasma sp.]
MDSVILETPILLCGFAAALGLNLFALVKKLRTVAILISTVLFVATATCSLLLGASLYEVAICAVAFFAVNLLPLYRR